MEWIMSDFNVIWQLYDFNIVSGVKPLPSTVLHAPTPALVILILHLQELLTCVEEGGDVSPWSEIELITLLVTPSHFSLQRRFSSFRFMCFYLLSSFF